MRWWLRHYDDEQLAQIATDFTGQIITAAGMARSRSILIASADVGDEE